MIIPILAYCLYHRLQSIGGWTNEDIVDIFADYADFCYSTFGDRIKMWITINEPQIISFLGYCIGLHAPGEKGYFMFIALLLHLSLNYRCKSIISNIYVLASGKF